MENQWNRNPGKWLGRAGLAAALLLILSAPRVAAEPADATPETSGNETAQTNNHPHAHGQHDETFVEKPPRERVLSAGTAAPGA